MRQGGRIDVDLLQRCGPHFGIEPVAGWGDNVWRKSPKEEVGGGDVTEPKDGESMLGGHGRVGEEVKNARVSVESGDGERGEGNSVKPDR
jgi:hypothetical protein